MPCARKSKRLQPPTEEDIFKSNYMQALNEKFKLRSQLGGLLHQLEDLDSAKYRIIDAQHERDSNKSQLPPPEQSIEKTAPPKAAPPKPQPTTKPKIEEEVVVTAEPKSAAVEHDESSNAEMASARTAEPQVHNSNPELQEELERLHQFYDDLTFYAVCVIFLLFVVMTLKEVRVLFVHMSLTELSEEDPELCDVSEQELMQSPQPETRYGCDECNNTPSNKPEAAADTANSVKVKIDVDLAKSNSPAGDYVCGLMP